MWIEEERFIKEEKEIMDKKRGIFLLEILRLRVYSLENSQSSSGVYGLISVCLSPLFPTPFISLR